MTNHAPDDGFLRSLGIEATIIETYTPLKNVESDLDALRHENDAPHMVHALERLAREHELSGRRYTNAAFYELLVTVYQRAKKERRPRLVKTVERMALSFVDSISENPRGLVASVYAERLVTTMDKEIAGEDDHPINISP